MYLIDIHIFFCNIIVYWQNSLFLAFLLNLVSSGWQNFRSALVEQQQEKEETLQGFA